MHPNQEPNGYHSALALIMSDIRRYTPDRSFSAVFRSWFQMPGLRYMIVLRLCASLRRRKSLYVIYIPLRLFLLHLEIKYGIEIPPNAEIGPGFYIGHFNAMGMNRRAKIGSNVSISSGVIIGQTNRGKDAGVPTIGNRVWIGPHAILVGAISVGDDALIAPGAYVNFDVPKSAVVVGNPGRVVSYRGSDGYATNLVPCEEPDLAATEFQST